MLSPASSLPSPHRYPLPSGVNNAATAVAQRRGRQQCGLRPANPTEEGLASLHSVLFHKQPSCGARHCSAIRYIVPPACPFASSSRT